MKAIRLHARGGPEQLVYVHSGAVTLSGLTAWQALFAHGGLQKGQTVLIYGGAGGVGVFAVQLARWRGAHVITTSSGANLQFLRGLGADQPIDYTKTRFEEGLRDIDLVLDAVGGDVVERSWPVLRSGGMMISVAQPIPENDARLHGARCLFFIVEPDRRQLDEMAALIDAGSLKSIVANVFPLSRARDAFNWQPRATLEARSSSRSGTKARGSRVGGSTPPASSAPRINQLQAELQVHITWRHAETTGIHRTAPTKLGRAQPLRLRNGRQSI